MLQVVICTAVKLFELGYDISSFEHLCSDLRTGIDALVELVERQEQVALVSTRVRIVLQQLQHLPGRVQANEPDRDPFEDAKANAAERRLRVAKSLKGCSVPTGRHAVRALISTENNRPKRQSRPSGCQRTSRTIDAFYVCKVDRSIST